MSLKHLLLGFLAVLVALTSCPSAYADNSVEVNIQKPLADAAYDYGDMTIDALIEEELINGSIPFAQRELFALILKTAMRRDKDHPNEYIRQDLLQNILKEELKSRLNPYSKRVEFTEMVFKLQKIFLNVQLGLISHQLMRLDPFVWETPQQVAEKMQMITNTQKELNSINKVTRLQGQINAPPNHLFKLGPAYRQLVDISRHGWDRSLNYDDGILDTPGIMAGRSEQEIADAEQEDDFSDVNDSLKDAVSDSDQAMDQFNQDMDANGTTKLLEATAQKNVELTDTMQEAEDLAVKANIKALAIGVMVGVAGTAVGMAMQSAPAMRSSYGYSSSPTSTASPATHVMRAPSMGGSFDGAAGQTLFTRF